MSNKQLEETFLVAVDQYIVMAENYILEHEQRIKVLASIGRDTLREQQMLGRFNEILQKMHAHRAEILAMLDE